MVALIAAVWLLLVPRTAVYFVDDGGRPYDIRVLYSWGTSDQILIFPKRLLDTDGPVDTTEIVDLVTGVRFDCGTAFTSGKNEDKNLRYGAGVVCSEIETPRRSIGLCLTAVGVVGLLGASKLPRLRES